MERQKIVSLLYDETKHNSFCNTRKRQFHQNQLSLHANLIIIRYDNDT